jgi:hypothetical protein
LLLARLAAAAKQPAELIDPTSGTGELGALTVAPSAVGTRCLHDGLSSVVPALVVLPGAAPVVPAG